MKKIIVSVIIFTFSSSYSQITKERFVSNSINSFKEGEWLQFRVHYGFFNASEIELELEKKNLLQRLMRARCEIDQLRMTKMNFRYGQLEDRHG